MKRLTTCLLALILLFSGCGIPSFETEKADFYKAWDRALQVGRLAKAVRGNQASEYPEELNLAEHPGLVTAGDFTGPIFCFGDPLYIPDMTKKEYTASNPLPADLEARVYRSLALEFQRSEHEAEFFSEEKLQALRRGEIPVVYMVLECTGYAGEGREYKDGVKTVQVMTLTWRTSFYSAGTGELLGWEAQPRKYASATFMDGSYYTKDANGNFVFSKHAGGVDELAPALALLLAS